MEEEKNVGFWGRISDELKRQGKNQRDLANAIGIHETSITGWKQGSIPRADIAVRIAQFLGVTVEWLVTGKELEQMSAEEREHLRKWRALGGRDKQVVDATIDAMLLGGGE